MKRRFLLFLAVAAAIELRADAPADPSRSGNEAIANVGTEADVDRDIAQYLAPRRPPINTAALGGAWKAVVRDASRRPVKVIIDTDIGTDVDDALAIAFALRREELQVCGITTSRLQVDQRAAIVSRLLQVMGRPDIPFAPGSAKRFDGTARHDKPVDQYPFAGSEADRPRAAATDAQRLFEQVIRANWGEVWLAVIGPMTNAAILIRDHPDLARGLAGIVCMGGEVVRASPETNIGNDPSAAAYVCRSGLLKFMGTDDITMRLLIAAPDIERLRRTDTPETRALLQLLTYWRPNAGGKPGPVAFDVCPVAWLFAPELFSITNDGVSVDERGITRVTPGAPPCAVTTDMNVVAVHRLLMDTLTRP